MPPGRVCKHQAKLLLGLKDGSTDMCYSRLPKAHEHHVQHHYCDWFIWLLPNLQTHCIRQMPESGTIFQICRCQAATEAAWQSFREVWGDLHPLSTARRLEALAELQPLAELQVRQQHAGKVKVPPCSLTIEDLASLAHQYA